MTGHILTPYPGTAFHRRLEAEGRIIDRNLEHYNTAHAVFRPKKLSPEALEAGYRWMYRRFYSWENILKRRPTIAGQSLAYLQFNLLYRKYGKLTSHLGKWVGMRRLAKLAKALAYPQRKAETGRMWLGDTSSSGGARSGLRQRVDRAVPARSDVARTATSTPAT
jgi:hypothetical protein